MDCSPLLTTHGPDLALPNAAPLFPLPFPRLLSLLTLREVGVGPFLFMHSVWRHHWLLSLTTLFCLKKQNKTTH